MLARTFVLCRHGVDQPSGVPLLPALANLNLIEGDFGYCCCIGHDMPRLLNAAARGRDWCAVSAILSRLEFAAGNGRFPVIHDAWPLRAIQSRQARTPEILRRWADWSSRLRAADAESAMIARKRASEEGIPT